MADSNDTITAVPGVAVGSWTDSAAGTGCTVVVFTPSAVAGVDVRGSSPGTRETDVLAPLGAVARIDAILLTGGSAFGLGAADGVVRWLEARGRGHPTPAGPVPIVPAAVIFDLMIGDAAVRPSADAGYAAVSAASAEPVSLGNVGAGAGAVVGDKRAGTKGGLGSAIRRRGALVVGALAVVNSVGNVYDPATGRSLAGSRDEDGRIIEFADRVAPGLNTTLGVVATNAPLTKVEATKVAQMAHDGLARVIRPAHGVHDGDTIFAASVGDADVDADVTAVGHLGAEAMAGAIVSAVRAATSAHGVPAAVDLQADSA